MKYSILDFDQLKAIGLTRIENEGGKEKQVSIDIVDLLILSDIAEMSNRKKIKKVILDDGQFSWISYNLILEDLPILRIDKKQLSRRLDKLESFGLIDMKVERTKGMGTFTYIRTGSKYEEIKYCRNRQEYPEGGGQKCPEGVDKNVQRDGQKCPPKDTYTIQDNNKHEEIARDKSLTKKESHENVSGEVLTVLPENRQDGFPTTRITDNTENREDNNNRPNEHIDLKDHEETNKPHKTAKRDSAWRESMEEYLKEVDKAKEELIEDADFKNKFLGMFPNADYLRSIMKSMQYWTSEKAWELKKKSKTKKINMLTTLKNNLDKSIVYKNQQDSPIENLRMLDIEYSDQEEGTLADGTFIKNGYRYYFSYKDKRAYSIPIKAPRMPGEKCEFDMKTNQWYLPRESETIDEWLW